jgi:uncharacterized membrane protein YraQ (UPF0718 family)
VTDEDTSKRKKMLRSWGYFALVGVVAIVVVLVVPERRGAVVETMWSYLVELALILPAVMILLGLFNEWVPDEMVVRYLGERSGVTGVGVAMVLGSTPTGPLYVAFPIAAELLEKNASVTNVVVFLTAWACLKLPQELIELQFLGWRFTALRLALTAVIAVGMGLVIETLLPNDRAASARVADSQ